MKQRKYIYILALVFGVMIILSGCTTSEWQGNNTGGPETYYVYGLNERCAGADGYCEIKSFSIINSLNVDNVTNENNYYAIVGIETDLTDDVLTDLNNRAELRFSVNDTLDLEFLLVNHNDGDSLIFKLPNNDSIDYQRLSQIELSDKQTHYTITGEYTNFPYINIFLGYFDTYCNVNGETYAGSYFLLQLKY
jgi:hypothetical protein